MYDRAQIFREGLDLPGWDGPYSDDEAEAPAATTCSTPGCRRPTDGGQLCETCEGQRNHDAAARGAA